MLAGQSQCQRASGGESLQERCVSGRSTNDGLHLRGPIVAMKTWVPEVWDVFFLGAAPVPRALPVLCTRCWLPWQGNAPGSASVPGDKWGCCDALGSFPEWHAWLGGLSPLLWGASPRGRLLSSSCGPVAHFGYQLSYLQCQCQPRCLTSAEVRWMQLWKPQPAPGECKAAWCFMVSEKGGNSTRQSSQIWAFPGRHAMYPTTSLPPQRGSCKLSVTKLPPVTPHFPESIGSTLITFSIHGSKEDHNIKSRPFKGLPSNLSQHYGLVINSALHSECHLPSSKRWNGGRTGRDKGNNHKATLTTVNVKERQQPSWMLKTTKGKCRAGLSIAEGSENHRHSPWFCPHHVQPQLLRQNCPVDVSTLLWDLPVTVPRARKGEELSSNCDWSISFSRNSNGNQDYSYSLLSRIFFRFDTVT